MSRSKRLRPLAGLLALGASAPAFAHSVPYPTYFVGLQPNGTYVVSNGQIISPAGKQVNLGIRVRAKAVALNPNPASHTAAVLTMGATQAVEVFDTRTGAVLQNYLPFQDSSGSYNGITYSADGSMLMFSQDSSYVTFAAVGPTGLLTDLARVPVPPNTSFIKCFPNSPIGDYGRTCGELYSPSTSYPGAVGFSSDGKSAYALLNQNNTFATIDLTQNPPVLASQFRVGNAPNALVINGRFAYVSNEGGRPAKSTDFQVYSAGTPIVADPVNGSAITGTVSVINLVSQKVVANIPVGLHPTGMALYGTQLLVSDTYSDTISVIDTTTNSVTRTIDLGLPIGIPGQGKPVYGASPNAIAVDQAAGIAYVTLYEANAVAVVNIGSGTVLGLIPVAYAPCSVVLNPTNNTLIVANDKGIGARLSFETDHGVTGYNSHQDNGTVSIVPIPDATKLAEYTTRVYQNNHWDLSVNIKQAGAGSSGAKPKAIPDRIGDPSTIKHVFLIIRENRTYDQVLGDVAAGNGDPTLAVFGDGSAAGSVPVTPNVHALVQRFPLLDNFYDPSRQSADGHQWIVEAMAPYQDDIQAPDWVRSYPGGNAGDALAYNQKGFLFQEAEQAGLSVKIYGEYVENQYWKNGEPSWSQFYSAALAYEGGFTKKLPYENQLRVESSIPAVANYLYPTFPQFDLNIPDQWRVDVWQQDFNNDVANNTVPALSILWVMDDHTGGPPTVQAEQADNDLAVGRIIDIISHSPVWSSSAIFMEEDDAQNGVDHIDGHRSPGYIVSPYAVQYGPTDHTFYTQVNMTRTIEQILGLQPLNAYDLIATPMRTDFTDTPNFAPWSHVQNQIPLDQGVAPSATTASPMAAAWEAFKAKMFQGKMRRADSVDPATLNHLDWYEATNFTRPYPGESAVRPPSDFANQIAHPNFDLGD